MGNKATHRRNGSSDTSTSRSAIEDNRKKNENSWSNRANSDKKASPVQAIPTLSSTSKDKDDGKRPRLSKVESISDPKYLKDREEWLNNNNPFVTDLDNTRIYVRGVRKVDDLEDLFSTDSNLYNDTLSPGKMGRQYTADLESGNDSMESMDVSLSPTTKQNLSGKINKMSTALEFDEDLDEKNSRLFRKATEIYAFCTDDPCIFTKEWGQSEAKPGDWIVISNQKVEAKNHDSSSSISNSNDSNTSIASHLKNAHQRDIYVISATEFQTNYVAVTGSPNKYMKKKAVRACRINQPFILKRAVEDQINIGNTGDYIVQSGSRQYIVRAQKFDREYELARSNYAAQIVGSIACPSRIKSFSTGLTYPEWGIVHEQVSISSLENLTMYDEKLISVLNEEMFHWGCDVFKIAEMSNQWPLVHMGWHLINSHYNLCEKLSIDQKLFLSFLIEVDDAYLPNPYHNNLHGADVMTSSHYIAKKTGFLDQMNDLELFSLLIAGLVHDIAHPGTSNSFQVNAQSTIAIRYNDHSVLENFHAATTFEILSDDKFQSMFPTHVNVEIFNKQGEREIVNANFRGTFRKYIIELVLATDLAKEVADPILNLFRSKTKVIAGSDNKPSLNFQNQVDRMLCLKMTIKCSDIAHGAKPLELHKQWSKLVTEEFLSQFEKENDLRLPHAFVVSTDPVKYAKSQAGFIRFVVLKCYTDFCSYVGGVGSEFKRNIKSNISYWNESKRVILASEHFKEINDPDNNGRQISISMNSGNAENKLFDASKHSVLVRNRIKSKDHRGLSISGDKVNEIGDNSKKGDKTDGSQKPNRMSLLKGNTVSMHHIVLESNNNDTTDDEHLNSKSMKVSNKKKNLQGPPRRHNSDTSTTRM